MFMWGDRLIDGGSKMGRVGAATTDRHRHRHYPERYIVSRALLTEGTIPNPFYEKGFRVLPPREVEQQT